MGEIKKLGELATTEGVEASKKIRYEIMNWLVLAIIIVILFFCVPFLTKKLLTTTFATPFSEQRKAIIKSNKTSDAASGVEGTTVNNIPLNLFENITNVSSKSFKELDIQIPKIYVTSPIFNTEKYG